MQVIWPNTMNHVVFKVENVSTEFIIFVNCIHYLEGVVCCCAKQLIPTNQKPTTPQSVGYKFEKCLPINLGE
jgi:hypothetical protein